MLFRSRLPGTYAIPYGVDCDIFHVRTPIEGRRPKVLWVGSEIFRTLKGYDDYVVPLARELAARGIECEPLLVNSFDGPKRTLEEMAAWYNTGTVLVCASEAEGTPNPALEAAACGCTVVSTRVGNMPALIRDDENGYLVDRDVGALVDAVLRAVEHHARLARRMQADIGPWSWTHRSFEYYRMFRDVLDTDGDPAGARRARKTDLSAQVTVFVTTVGGPAFQECLAHLCQQDAHFVFELIQGVAPLSAALQQMLDTCLTPYLIQVDEDMLLHPHAVRTLVERLDAQPPHVVTFVANLWDVHLGRATQGVKISRRQLARRYPWRDTPNVLDRNRRMKADGLAIATEPTEGIGPGAPVDRKSVV